MKSTNYYNTFIYIAEQCTKEVGTIPPKKTPPTVARITYDLLNKHPYKYISDELLRAIYIKRHGKENASAFDIEKQACFRCSPLTKTYGWGIHCNKEGKMAMYGVESDEYNGFIGDGELEHKIAFSVKR